MRSDCELNVAQHWIAQTALDLKRVYMAAEMGFGKTAACLWFIHRLQCRMDLEGKVLIVAPLEVARNTWPDEIAEWRFSSGFRYAVMAGMTAAEREAARLSDAEIHIVNFANVVWLYKRWREEKRWPYQVIIFDEASRLKSGRKRTAKTKRKDGSVSGRMLSAFGALANRAFRFEYCVLLSGTPSPNGHQDLWGPMYLVDGGERLGLTKSAFERRFFVPKESGYGLRIRDGAGREIERLISDRMFALKAADFGIEMPATNLIDKWVRLSEQEMKKYRAFEREMYLEEFDIDAVNDGVLVGKLLQFANGHVYDAEEKAHQVHQHKFDMLESIVEECAGRSVLLAYCYRFDLAVLRKRYPKWRVFGDSKDDVRDWNSGRLAGMIAHPAQIGHGLNLQHGGDLVVWFGLPASLEWYQQLNKRLVRPGQKAESVDVVRILARNTEDVRQARRLETKGMTQDAITDAVAVYREEVVDAHRRRSA